MTSTSTQSINDSETTILLIDDNQVNNKLVASILMPQGYNIYIADCGKSGIKMTQNLIPDVILLDIMMPVIDGFQVCKHLQKDPLTREIPIIFLTADSSIKTQTSAFQLGGSDFITKPIVDVVLIERIKNQLRLSRNKKRLKTLNNYYQLAEEISNTGFWAYQDVPGNESFTFSSQLARILNLNHDGRQEATFSPVAITSLLKSSKDSITRKEYARRWEHCLANGGLFDEVCSCRINDSTRFIRLWAKFTRESDGCFTGFGAVQDISRVINTENELAELKAGLEEQTSKQHIVEVNTQLAHEINQPLAAINLNVNYIRQLIDSEPYEIESIRDTLDDIGNDVGRATNIVKNIRRIIKKEPALVRKFDLYELLDETVYVFNREILQKNIELLFNHPDRPCIVNFDRTGLQQVIVNLLKNAIEAISNADIESPVIEVTTEKNRKETVIQVSDNGPGISKEVEELIFQQYYTSKKGNTGMGLAICKALMIELDGDIQLSDPPADRTTCFKVTIPC